MRLHSSILVTLSALLILSIGVEAKRTARLKNKLGENEAVKPAPEFHEDKLADDDTEQNELATSFWMSTASSDGCENIVCENNGACVGTRNIGPQCICLGSNTGTNCQLAALVNAASYGCGATCAASSEAAPCENAINGNFFDSDWYTYYGETNNWIQIYFTKYYFMVALKIRQRCHQNNQIKQIGVIYGDGSESQMTLECHNSGFSDTNCLDTSWQDFDLEPVVSRNIRINIYSVCRQNAYIGIKELNLYAYDVALINIGAIINGATCNASSVYNPTDFKCDGALDGDMDPANVGSEWASNGQGMGAWIEIYFDGIYDVVAIDLLPRCDFNMHMWRVMADFSGGAQYEISLTCGGGATIFDCDGQEFQTFQMSPVVINTSWVRLTITGICTSENNHGFREVQVFGIRSLTMRSLERQSMQHHKGNAGIYKH